MGLRLPYCTISKLDIAWLKSHLNKLRNEIGFQAEDIRPWMPIDFCGIFPVFVHCDLERSKDYWGLTEGWYFRAQVSEKDYEFLLEKVLEESHSTRRNGVITPPKPTNENGYLQQIEKKNLWIIDPRSQQNEKQVNTERTRLWIKALMNGYNVLPINVITYEKEVIKTKLEKKFDCRGVSVIGNVRQILIEDVIRGKEIEDELSLEKEEASVMACYAPKEIIESLSDDSILMTENKSEKEVEEKSFNCDEFDLSELEGKKELTEEEIDEYKDNPNIVLAYVFKSAIKQNASDIHIHEIDGKTILRYRINTYLHDKHTFPKSFLPRLHSIISQNGGMSIHDKKIPHSGKFSAICDNRKFDIRVSLIPCGEEQSCVLRLHGREKKFESVETLGLEHDHDQILRNALRKKNGIILVTGPTGSGKSTTLYAAIEELSKNTTLSIVTIEDPIEKKIERVKQFQVVYYKDKNREHLNLSFPVLFREVLRHDPDVIMIGEIRDKETAMQAIQAAQTGHLLLSTLHTNDAIGSIKRLVSLGVSQEQLGDSLILLEAQRLLGFLCPDCKRKAEDEYVNKVMRLLTKQENCVMQFISGKIGDQNITHLKKVLSWSLNKPENSINTLIGQIVSNDTITHQLASPNNPYSVMKGKGYSQDCSIACESDPIVHRIFFKEIPVTEVEFIHPFYFEPYLNEIKIEVEGTAMCDTISSKTGNCLFQCTNLIASLKEGELLPNNYSTKIDRHDWISVFKKFSFGTHPNNLILEDHRQRHHFLQTANRTTVIQYDGSSLSSPVSGVYIQEFDGTNKLIIDPRAVTACALKINCTTEKSMQSGIVVVGIQTNQELALKVVSTNGKVWLHGSHSASPLAIGSTNPHWIFTEANWRRENVPYAQLNFRWNGYLSCTAPRITFSSPQSASKNGQLNLSGTLMLCGILKGNLQKVIVKESQQKQQLAPFVEHFKTFIDIQKL